MQRSLRSLLSVVLLIYCQWINVRQGKILCWKDFSNADSSVHESFRKLGHVPREDGTKNAL